MRAILFLGGIALPVALSGSASSLPDNDTTRTRATGVALTVRESGRWQFAIRIDDVHSPLAATQIDDRGVVTSREAVTRMVSPLREALIDVGGTRCVFLNECSTSWRPYGNVIVDSGSILRLGYAETVAEYVLWECPQGKLPVWIRRQANQPNSVHVTQDAVLVGSGIVGIRIANDRDQLYVSCEVTLGGSISRSRWRRYPCTLDDQKLGGGGISWSVACD
jgi:hypothetical protein